MKTAKLKQYTISFIFLLAVDFVWLAVLMKDFYDMQFSVFERTLVVWSAALAWILIPLGIVLFVLPLSKKISDAAKNGAFYGLILYGVYDLTNYATLAKWPMGLVIVDTLWGTFLCLLTSVMVFGLSKKWNL
ncbi:DUF2177 family protein [Candidatus Woesearchaeota archaeon]|nr:DUF2177 family protein [Candidatus Woesearchaeota archaeon]